jgi:hypothetical protein
VDLAARLRSAAEGDLATAIAELDELLEETLDLIDRHAPTVDTAPPREDLAAVRDAG